MNNKKFRDIFVSSVLSTKTGSKLCKGRMYQIIIKYISTEFGPKIVLQLKHYNDEFSIFPPDRLQRRFSQLYSVDMLANPLPIVLDRPSRLYIRCDGCFKFKLFRVPRGFRLTPSDSAIFLGNAGASNGKLIPFEDDHKMDLTDESGCESTFSDDERNKSTHANEEDEFLHIL